MSDFCEEISACCDKFFTMYYVLWGGKRRMQNWYKDGSFCFHAKNIPWNIIWATLSSVGSVILIIITSKFTEHMLCTNYEAKCLICTISFNIHKEPWGNYFKVTQLISWKQRNEPLHLHSEPMPSLHHTQATSFLIHFVHIFTLSVTRSYVPLSTETTHTLL